MVPSGRLLMYVWKCEADSDCGMDSGVKGCQKSLTNRTQLELNVYGAEGSELFEGSTVYSTQKVFQILVPVLCIN